MCPSYLDGDHAHGLSAEHAVIPVCWHGCAVFKVREEGARPDWALGLSKLNSMGRARRARAPPGPVDISVAASAPPAPNAPAEEATAPILELP